MAWPLSQDYNEAIQSPARNFSDPDLCQGKAVVGALGIPMPCSGNFADVYQVRCPDGSRWAVKCFTRESPGLRERYQEISRHLRQAQLPFTVDFSYLERGICVLGKWFPILKMQWVEGLTLNQFVAQNLDKPAMLDGLQHIWVRMSKYLREAEVAHGDLQHGNVLLVPGANSNALALKLIDYDGMYVPSLARTKSGEVGHPSYQHPLRAREEAYNREVDRFPLLLIDTSLRALSINGRALWDKYDNGDNLLFKEADLQWPTKSMLFLELFKSPDPKTVELAKTLFDALRGGLSSVPLLEEVMPDAPPTWLTSPPAARLNQAPRQEKIATSPKQSTDTNAKQAITTPDRSVSQANASRPTKTIIPSLTRPNEGRTNSKKMLLLAAFGGVAVLMFLGILAIAGFWFAKFTTTQRQLAQETLPKGSERKVPKSQDVSSVGKQPPKADSTPEIKPDPKPDPTPEVKPDPKPEVKPDPKPEVKPDPKPEVNPDPKPEVKPDPKPEVKPDPDQRMAKLPIPAEEAQTVARNLIKDIFKDEYSMKDKASVQALAQKFLQQGTETKDDHAAKFVLFCEARDLFSRIGDHVNALKAVEQIAKEFAVEEWEMKNSVLNAVITTGTSSEGYLAIAVLGLTVANDAVVKDDYGEATLFLTTAEKAARKAQNLSLVTKIQARQKVVADFAKKHEQVKVLIESLKEKPDDPEANLMVGKFYCLTKGEWEKGLPYLVRGQDTKLKALAEKELANPTVVAKQIELADAWWDIAKDEKSAEKRSYQMQAYKWYELAAPTLSGLEQTRVEKRIDYLVSQLPELNLPLELRNFAGHTDTVLCVLFSPDGRKILSGGKDGTARLWNLDTGKELQTFRPKGEKVIALAFSGDGSQVFSGTSSSPDKEDHRRVGMEIWNVGTGRTVNNMEMLSPANVDLNIPIAFLPQGKKLLVASTYINPGGPLLCKVDVVNLEKQTDFRNPLVEVGATATCLAVSGDGTKFLTGSVAKDQALRLWDMESGKAMALGTQSAGAQCVFVSTNGKRALSGGADKIIHVWDLTNGKSIKLLSGHSGTITCVAFSPDGNRVLSGSEDKTVRLWDVQTGKELCRFTSHTDTIHSVAFSPDGHQAVSAGDKTVRLYRLPR